MKNDAKSRSRCASIKSVSRRLPADVTLVGMRVGAIGSDDVGVGHHPVGHIAVMIEGDAHRNARADGRGPVPAECLPDRPRSRSTSHRARQTNRRRRFPHLEYSKGAYRAGHPMLRLSRGRRAERRRKPLARGQRLLGPTHPAFHRSQSIRRDETRESPLHTEAAFLKCRPRRTRGRIRIGLMPHRSDH